MKLIAITITAYLTGYLVFLTGNFVFDKYHEWDRAWFIWNNVANAGILFWVTLYKLAPPSLKKIRSGSLRFWHHYSTMANGGSHCRNILE